MILRNICLGLMSCGVLFNINSFAQEPKTKDSLKEIEELPIEVSKSNVTSSNRQAGRDQESSKDREAKSGKISLLGDNKKPFDPSFFTSKQGIKVGNGNAYVIVQALYDGMIHVETSAVLPGPSVEEALYKTLLVSKERFPGPSLFTTEKNGFSTSKLRVSVEPKSLCVSVFKIEESTAFNKVCPYDLTKGTKYLTFNAPFAENVYGLGQYMSDPLTLNSDWIGKTWEPGPYGNQMRGYRRGATGLTQMPIMYVLGKGKDNHGVFFDNFYRQRWDFTKSPWSVGTWGDQLRYFVFVDKDLPSLRKRYMDLTGKPPMLNKQLLGLWSSEFGFDNWQEINSNINQLKKNKYPLDGLSLDLQWYGTRFNDPDRSTMGSLRWDQKNFPDPEKHIEFLKNTIGVELVLIEQPYISAAIPEYKILDAKGYMVRDCETCNSTFITYSTWWGRGGYLDFTNPSTNEFWHKEKRRKLIDIGVNGHWTDLGEPEMYHAHAWYYGFPDLGLHQHGDVHNIYNFKWVEGIYQGYRNDGINKRPIILTRSGNAGQQRYGVAMWSGDIAANLDSMNMQTQNQVNVSLSGIDYYGSDVGGFWRTSGDGREHQLYTMWFANASLTETPVRAHTWNLTNTYSSSPAVMGHNESNLENIRRRYSLIPYYYSLAYKATKEGEAIIAPLVYYWQEDANLRKIADQKMVGPYLNVAAITQYEQAVRSVYLPQGEWVDYYNGEAFESSGEWIENYPLFRDGILRLPIFAKKGAILPQMRVPQEMFNTMGRRLDGSIDTALKIKVFPGSGTTEFDLYEDDGKSYDYEHGEFALTNITQTTDSSGTTKIVIDPTQGEFSGAVSKRDYILTFVQGRDSLEKITFNGNILFKCAPEIAGQLENDQLLSTKSACFANNEFETQIYLGELSTGITKEVIVETKSGQETLAKTTFVCEDGYTVTGESIYIVGNIPQLGNWDIEKSVKLRPNAYPTWSIFVDDLPANTSVEWKCFKHDPAKKKGKTPGIVWQKGPNNVVKLTTGYNGAKPAKM